MDDQINDILKRLEKIEQKVFGSNANRAEPFSENFKGAKGGILLIISEGYFTSKRANDDTIHELAKHGYQYDREVVRKALGRLCKGSNAPLTTFLEEGQRVYVIRK